MASLDKQSVREEFDKIKSQFNQLKKQKKVSPEVSAIVTVLITLMDFMLAIFLEKQTKKDAKNSSKPSSQTDKDESSLSHKGSNGKGKFEKNTLAKNTRINESVTLMKLYDCDSCGRDLESVPSAKHEINTKISSKTLDRISRVNFRHLHPTCK